MINFSNYFLSYGCVRFDTAGDIFFQRNITENDFQKKCVSECFEKYSGFQFFITSFFTGLIFSIYVYIYSQLQIISFAF